jgi:hypothetical protein
MMASVPSWTESAADVDDAGVLGPVTSATRAPAGVSMVSCCVSVTHRVCCVIGGTAWPSLSPLAGRMHGRAAAHVLAGSGMLMGALAAVAGPDGAGRS